MKRKIIISLVLFFVLLFSTIIFAATPKLPNVTIITTGGTIAETADQKSGGVVPTLTGDVLVKAVAGLDKIANITVVNFSNIDSSQMTPELWTKLSRTADDILKDKKVAGVVITHGTDSMAEAAYFLDLTIKSKKPVVLVGAMRSASDLSADGSANILNAVTQVCSPKAQNWGVTVTLNQFICSARNVRKTETTNVQTFNCGEKGYLGYIAMGKVFRYNEALGRQKLPLPIKLPNVVLITEYAGSDGSFIYQAADKNVEGIVVEGVGAGNVNSQTYKAIKYALAKNIPVVITSRVFDGRVYPMYGDEGGGATLKKDGAILGGDLSAPKARLLLMLGIPVAKGDKKKLSALFE